MTVTTKQVQEAAGRRIAEMVRGLEQAPGSSDPDPVVRAAEHDLWVRKLRLVKSVQVRVTGERRIEATVPNCAGRDMHVPADVLDGLDCVPLETGYIETPVPGKAVLTW